MSNVSNERDVRKALGWFQPANDERIQLYSHGLGAEIGRNEALILMQIIFLVNATQNSHDAGRKTPAYRDGYAWTFHSAEQFERDYFQSISFRAIQEILKKFEEFGLLIVASKNYNKPAYDRTKWYRPNVEQINQLRWRGGPGIEGLSKPLKKTRTEQRKNREAAVIEQRLQMYDQQIAEELLSEIEQVGEIQQLITQDERNQLRKSDVTDYVITASAIPETPYETSSETPTDHASEQCSDALLAKARKNNGMMEETLSKDGLLTEPEDYDWSFHYEQANSEAFYGEDTAIWNLENLPEHQANLERDYAVQGQNNHLQRPERPPSFDSHYRVIPVHQAIGA